MTFTAPDILIAGVLLGLLFACVYLLGYTTGSIYTGRAALRELEGLRNDPGWRERMKAFYRKRLP